MQRSTSLLIAMLSVISSQASFAQESAESLNQGRNSGVQAVVVPVESINADAAADVNSSDQDEPSRAPETPLRTQVFAEDLVVQGSICAGIDCISAENFGSDTLRIKENNVRIHFDDTSTGTFPANDWRITVNDQASGGANYIAIDDATANRTLMRINSGGFANSVYVAAQSNSSPRVGIGTSNPAFNLQVFGSDTPGTRIEQVGGFGNVTWDVAGNETNFFIRNVTNSSALPFRIRAQAPTNTLLLGNGGEVGVNLTGGNNAAPQAVFHVGSNNTSAGDTLVRVDDSSGATVLSLDDNGDMTLAGTLSQLSSAQAKEHFAHLDNAALIETLAQLDIYTWNYKHQEPDERHLGPTAEDFYAAFGLGRDPQHIAVSDVAGVALASTQVLAQRLLEKEQQLQSLEQRMAAMEALLHSLVQSGEAQASLQR